MRSSPSEGVYKRGTNFLGTEMASSSSCPPLKPTDDREASETSDYDLGAGSSLLDSYYNTDDEYELLEETSTALTRVFNSRNAKLLAVLLLLPIGIYHALLRIHFREDSCVGLLKDGRYQGSHVWQPYGCMLHRYSRADSRMCMKRIKTSGTNTSVYFLGAWRTRQLYERFVNRFSKDTVDAAGEVGSSLVEHSFHDFDLGLDASFVPSLTIDASVVQRLRDATFLPSLLILTAEWPLSFSTSLREEHDDRTIEQFVRNLSQLRPPLAQLRANGTTVLWLLQPSLYNRSATRRNRLLQRVNERADRLLGPYVKMWRSAQLLAEAYAERQMGDWRLETTSVEYATEILVNLLCNGRRGGGVEVPGGVCCAELEPPHTTQTVLFVVAIFCTVLSMVIGGSKLKMGAIIGSVVDSHTIRRYAGGADYRPLTNQRTNYATGSQALFLLTELCLLMLYAYLCDRQNFFMKENKWFSYFNLFLPIVYLTVLGLFFTETTKNTKTADFLNRDQLDECKGWVVLMILCCNVTGSSQVLWIYMMSRCFMSALIFLLGYAQFTYLWNTGEFDPLIMVKKLANYNLTAVFLCLALNRPYQFYELAPTLSFWHVTTYLTLALPPRVTAESAHANPVQYLLVVVKLTALFAVMSIIYMSEVFFQEIFLAQLWRPLFLSKDGTVTEWWDRWRFDRYTAAVGMSMALLISGASHFKLIPLNIPCENSGAGADNSHHHKTGGTAENLLKSHWASFGVTLLTLMGFAFYALVIRRCVSRTDCAEIHPYLAPLPITAYLLLRNLFGCVRKRVSTFFSWFGAVAYELLTVQYHVWLAADGAGVLVLLPRWPVLNVILVSFIFASFCHELRRLNRRLLWLVLPECGESGGRRRCSLLLALGGVVTTLLLLRFAVGVPASTAVYATP